MTFKNKIEDESSEKIQMSYKTINIKRSFDRHLSYVCVCVCVCVCKEPNKKQKSTTRF